MLQCRKYKKDIVGNIFELGRGRVINQEEINSNPGIYPVYSSQSINNGEMGRISTFDFEGEYITWTTDGAYAGTVFYRNGKFNCTNVCGTLHAINPFCIDTKYFSYLLGENTKKYVSYVGNPKLMNGVVNDIPLNYVEDKNNQTYIANILSTCDEVIEKTEETIEKYKQIKSGMMQDLFTRGLDENGKLRPTYKQSPELYKYSEELDRFIPKEWDVTKLLDCCIKPCSYGINAPAVDFDTNLPLYLRITDITEDGKYNKQGRKCVDSIDASKYILENNDIVFARTGATVGKTYLYNINDGQLVYAGFLICFSLDSSIVDSYFVKTYTETDYYLNWVTVYSQRSGQPGINGNEYSKMLLAKPLRKEQEKIGTVFKKIDEKISYEIEYLNKYKQIKQGLMKRLLTPPADAEIVEE